MSQEQVAWRGGYFIIISKLKKQVRPIKSQNFFFNWTITSGTQDNAQMEQCDVMIGCGWVSWYRRGGCDTVHPVIASLVWIQAQRQTPGRHTEESERACPQRLCIARLFKSLRWRMETSEWISTSTSVTVSQFSLKHSSWIFVIIISTHFKNLQIKISTVPTLLNETHFCVWVCGFTRWIP